MKYKLAILGAVAVLMASCATSVSTNQTDTERAPSSETSKTASTAIGSFRAAEHPTQGNARIVNQNGKRFVEFNEEFKTDNGPDLYVILHRNATVPDGIKEKDYVQLARLQRTNGVQRYAIPENVQLADFKSVAIWCRQFNATFGYAPLSSSNSGHQ
ncbi:electron transfer flavoprotein [Calothrix sp. HK-06]|nr:electron transfer flavoprotein [Calothrix sp. HK-06]